MDEIIEAAYRRYHRDSPGASQPARGSETYLFGKVTLRNINGPLATYKVSRDSAGRVRLSVITT